MKEINKYIVTGATSFLGKAFLEVFSRDTENTVYAVTRKKMSNGSKYGANIKFIDGIDLSDYKQVVLLREKLTDELDTAFTVINCVGHFPGYKRIEELNGDEIRRTYESNVISVTNIGSVFLPLMKEHNKGDFIAFSMNTAYQSYPMLSAFIPSKVAVQELIKIIANEYSQYGISANIFALSTLMTEKELELKPHGDKENWLHPITIAEYVEKFFKNDTSISNGNVIRLFKHSDRFFNDSYYNRTRK